MVRFIKKLVNLIGILIITVLILSGLYTIISHMSLKNVQVKTGEKVGVVPIKGIISTSKRTIKQLNTFEKDSTIKAIVLRIDSPGGMVGPTQEIWEKVMEIKKKKKVYASIGSVGASGAYYIASGADYIMADPGSIVGSIGVIMEFPNIKGLMEKVGVKMNVVKSGTLKDTGSPFRDMSEKEKEYLKSVIDDVYDQFLTAVSLGRGIDKNKLKPIADGRIMSGRMAKKWDLVDGLGGMEKLKKVIEKDLKVKSVRFVYPPKRAIPLIERILWGDEGKGSKIIYPPGLYYLWEM